MCYNVSILSLFLFTDPEEEKMKAVMDVLSGLAGVGIVVLCVVGGIAALFAIVMISNKFGRFLKRYKKLDLDTISVWLYIPMGVVAMIASFVFIPYPVEIPLFMKGLIGVIAALAAPALFEAFVGNPVKEAFQRR